MWHAFVYELAVDGNWIADVEGRAEILWSEDFSEWGVGVIELRYLRFDPTPENPHHLREWYEDPSLRDPVARLILPSLRARIRPLYGSEIAARSEEARHRADAANRNRSNDLS